MKILVDPHVTVNYEDISCIKIKTLMLQLIMKISKQNQYDTPSSMDTLILQ